MAFVGGHVALVIGPPRAGRTGDGPVAPRYRLGRARTIIGRTCTLEASRFRPSEDRGIVGDTQTH